MSIFKWGTEHWLEPICVLTTANQSEVVITRNGLPIVRIVPCQTTPIKKHYPLRGKPITIASDFDNFVI
ncbi:hypothetical protein IQ236_20885 [Planktothrix mougeotii LEGE 06226]|uniref:Prevent-host-death protein n=1 Tax=Planktothrix mougeotii LEGE 06226 TaxID=1828728 RepID=A0ABR9UII5_9CYAN|nr:hypothetical protein [Planktothrix mougeotii LEGE 06226]